VADLLHIVVEERDNMEAATTEPAIPKQGPAEVPQSDQGQRPIAIDPQDAPERGDQFLDAVPDAGITELPKKRQIMRTWALLSARAIPS
jgi:hypothetical protein